MAIFHDIMDRAGRLLGIVTTTGGVTIAKEAGGNLDTIAGDTTSLDSKAPALGQGIMAASIPVAVASNQSPVPISVASLPLPAGAATSALQVDPRVDVSWLVAVVGAVTGLTTVRYNIMGRRSLGWTSTSVLGDVVDYLDTTQASMNTPTVGQTLYAVSTSLNDDGAPVGTGVRTVRIVYLDAAGAQQVTTATLDGTTPVSLGTGFTAIQWMESATVGSGSVAAGNITISSTNGAATVATTFERIAAGANRSLSGRYTVPTGKTGYINSWDGGASGAKMDMRIRADVFSDDRAVSTGVFHFQDNAYVADAGLFTGKEMHYFKCPAGSTVKVSAIPGSAPAGNRCDASFDFLVVG